VSRIVIDTNAYSALMGGDTRIVDILAKAEAVLLTPIVIGELLDGFAGGNKDKENREILGRFRIKPRAIMVPITDETSEWFASIKRQLRKKGRPIPINDVWIAASCMEHGSQLLTFDSHFEEIDGLIRVKI
jgi:tRNA(fMet)-specific endonuclease VapC